MQRWAGVLGVFLGFAACSSDEGSLPDARVEGFDTVIDRAPAAATNVARAEFEFHATRDATFTCALDGGAASPCTSPHAVEVEPGPHDLAVVATSRYGHLDTSPATAAWLLDVTPPDAVLVLAPGALDHLTLAHVEFSSPEPGITFLCSFDGGAFVPCTSPWEQEVGAGTHTLVIVAVDAAGNADPTPLVVTWTVDPTVPDTAIDAGPAAVVGPLPLAFALSSTTLGVSFECALGTAPLLPCAAAPSFPAQATGNYVLSARARTAAGGVDPTPATWAFIVDATAPVLALSQAPAALDDVATPTFAFAADEPATFECAVDGAVAFGACTSPWTSPGLPDGPLVFRLRGTDLFGNAAEITHDWTLEAAVCGDGVVGGLETCDDGNDIIKDGCTYCQLDCGDGGVNAAIGEECDDGNRVDGDGCDATCKIDCPEVGLANACIGDACCAGAARKFIAGQGTAADPYQLETACQLGLVRSYPSCDFELIDDIDLAGLTFAPIPLLSGSLDGRGHRISGWTYGRPTPWEQGAFIEQILAGATVERLIFEDASLTSVSGSGLLAVANAGTIRQVAVIGVLNTQGNSNGALVSVNTGLIDQVAVNVALTSAWYGAGIAVENQGTIRDSYSRGPIWSYWSSGAVRTNPGTLERVLAMGPLTGWISRQGLSYFSPPGTVLDSYWDVDVTTAPVTDGGGTGLTELEVGQVGSYPGWDFGNVWSMDASNQPYLRWYPDPVDRLLCGDGEIDAGEVCDDGNRLPGDGCAANCLTFTCGDGVLDPGEACDDGNVVAGDGCDQRCTSDESCGNGLLDAHVGEICDDGNASGGDGCSAACDSDETCGNGFYDWMLGEGCDDGNTLAGDGCSDVCQWEYCGDGIVSAALGEQCDDGNFWDGDGCSSACWREECGNWVVDWAIGEICDDGNLDDGDGCSAACNSDETCGNWVVDTALGEVCDDGNLDSGDGCAGNCLTFTCGDGVVDFGEACDDGNIVAGDGCDETCTSDESCGNGIVDAAAGETCDDGNLDPDDGCSPACVFECGDGVLAASEACDDGNVASGDGCSPTCEIEYCGGTVVAATFGAGTGYLVAPYELASVADLDRVRLHGECAYALTADLDLTGVAFEPIPSLTGSLDGRGHRLTGWAYDATGYLDGRGGPARVGFIVELWGRLEHVIFEDAAITGLEVGGGLAAGTNWGVVRQVSTSGLISGNGMIGGVVGLNYYNATIAEARSEAVVDSTEQNVGGLAGYSLWNGSITDSFAAGAVGGSNGYVGGLAGSSEGTLQRVYAAGAVTSPGTPVGGLVATNSGSVSASYWDLDTTGQATSAAGQGISSAAMANPGSFVGWDFATVWIPGPSGRPELRWYLDAVRVCGNSVVELGEVCDDGNVASGDGCAGNCLTFTCGDGVVDAIEACDDGNILAGDGCSADCTSDETCGNGVADWGLGEACDDGNLDDGDGCSNACQLPVCGDGVVQGAEPCDDGNAGYGDGCTPACALEYCDGEATVASFAGGTGYPALPYLVADGTQLAAISNHASCAYRLVADVDLAGASWTPIATFTGELDGGYHQLSNFTIDGGGNYVVGLIGYLYGTVRRLRVDNATVVNAGGYGGVIAGYGDGVLEQVSADGVVQGGEFLGGLVGALWGGSLTQCRAGVQVTGTHRLGGLVGAAAGAISACYADGPVAGETEVAGLVSYTYSPLVDSYAAGAVSSIYDPGVSKGLTASDVGGPVTSCYWDVDATGTATSAGGDGLTTAQMALEGSFVGWDFVDDWTLADGIRPELRWYAEVLAAVCGNGLLERGEVCDDGNVLGGDGCAATCWSVDG